MKLVFDTNVLIAALIAPEGVCAELVKHCVQLHEVCTCQFILDELREKLIVKFGRATDDTDKAVALFRDQFHVVEPAKLEGPVCRDPDDDQVLGAAIAADASCVITGDRDLLTLRTYKGTTIIKPSGFADFEKSKVDG